MKFLRNIFSLLLCLNLVVSAIGIPVVVHSCGGEVESVHFFATTAHCADDAGCEENGCCSNTVSIEQWHFDATMHSAVSIAQDVLSAVLPLAALQLFEIPGTTQAVEFASTKDAPRRPPPLLMSMRC